MPTFAAAASTRSGGSLPRQRQGEANDKPGMLGDEARDHGGGLSRVTVAVGPDGDEKMSAHGRLLRDLDRSHTRVQPSQRA